ncbi:MAG TPA: hypothetical protein VKX17_19800 [Planctomycetota bacterium]|nr:hypothetical protein [Planctomycetota bacterium]
MKTFALLLMVVTVYVLHQDWWNWDKYQPLLFGFVPVGLWYHGLFAVLCAVNMWVLGRFAWPKHLEEVEAHVLQQPDRGDRGGGH